MNPLALAQSDCTAATLSRQKPDPSPFIHDLSSCNNRITQLVDDLRLLQQVPKLHSPMARPTKLEVRINEIKTELISLSTTHKALSRSYLDFFKNNLPLPLWFKIISHFDQQGLQTIWPSLTAQEKEQAIPHLSEHAAFWFIHSVERFPHAGNPRNILRLDWNNPVRHEPKLQTYALKQVPELFFELSDEELTSPDMKMKGFLAAALQQKWDVCERIINPDSEASADLVYFAQAVRKDIMLLKDTNLRASFFEKHPSLRSNKKAILALTTIFRSAHDDPDFLLYASEEIRHDPSFVQSIVSLSGVNLKYVPHFQNNFNIVLSAIKEKGYALRYASNELKMNETIARAAVEKDGIAIQYVNQDLLRRSRDIVVAGLENPTRGAYMHLPDDLKKDTEYAMMEVIRNPHSLVFVPKEASHYELIARTAYQRKPETLKYVPEKLQPRILAG